MTIKITFLSGEFVIDDDFGNIDNFLNITKDWYGFYVFPDSERAININQILYIENFPSGVSK
jgi:hypothetical protein